MRFIKGYGFENEAKKRTSPHENSKTVCTSINVTNPLVSLTGEVVSYEAVDYLNSLRNESYVGQFKAFLASYSEPLLDAIDLGLINQHQLPNLNPLTFADAKRSVGEVRELLSSVPIKLIELLMVNVNAAKRELIAGGVPHVLIEEFETKFSPDFDFSYDGSNLVFEAPSIDSCAVIDIDSFGANSKAASSLISFLCENSRLFEQGVNAAYYDYLEAGEPISDKKTVEWVDKVLGSELYQQGSVGQVSWLKLVQPLMVHINKSFHVEVHESLSMQFDDLNVDRFLSSDESYITELANERYSVDCDIGSLVTQLHSMLTTIASFSFLASRFEDGKKFSRLNKKNTRYAKLLASIYSVASKAVDDEILEIANEDHIGLRTFVLPDFLMEKNEKAYGVIDDIYNRAFDVDELALNFNITLSESHIQAVTNVLINTYCTRLLEFISHRPHILNC